MASRAPTAGSGHCPLGRTTGDMGEEHHVSRSLEDVEYKGHLHHHLEALFLDLIVIF